MNPFPGSLLFGGNDTFNAGANANAGYFLLPTPGASTHLAEEAVQTCSAWYLAIFSRFQPDWKEIPSSSCRLVPKRKNHEKPQVWFEYMYWKHRSSSSQARPHFSNERCASCWMRDMSSSGFWRSPGVPGGRTYECSERLSQSSRVAGMSFLIIDVYRSW